MKHLKRKGQLNNEGLTLIELLVAVIILTIVVVPIFRNFVVSAKLNAKSRDTMNGTNVAENIMEQFEAYSIEEMLNKMLAKGYTISYTEDTNGDTLINSEDLKVKLTGQESIATNLSYDIEILLDGYSEYSGVNATPLSDIQNLSGGTNALFVDAMDQEVFAIDYFENNSVFSEDELKKKVSKKIEIEIEKNPISVSLPSGEAAGVDTYKVTSRCYFECDSSVLTNPANNIYPLDRGEMLIFSNEDDVRARALATGNTYNISRLDNVVICVVPRYYSAVLYDSVIVKNDDNVDTGVLLVKQNLEGEVETNYRLKYQLRELHAGWMEANGASISSHAKLRTNVSSPFFIDNVEFVNIYNLEDISGNYARDIVGLEGLTPGRISGRLYEITVNVYQRGTTNRVVSMSGTVGM